ncbi:ScbR family autoregulator-binding transcription factor [Streptomyces sp. NPDC051684]|uniref:ScbR family autoregulator-binding transcription factor n=1 Tax=Streptomyces sp. NPDC051684 TaxID=3365670 RepID=UPI0037B9CC2D
MAKGQQERALATRRILLLAAAEVFDECGYAGAGIAKILQRTDLTAGALYFHFGSKQGLAQAVMNAQPEALSIPEDVKGMQKLIDLLLTWSFQLQRDPLLRAGVRLTDEQATFGMRDVTPYSTWRTIMQDCLEEAHGAGDLRAGVEPERVATFLVGTCTGLQTYSQVESGREDLPERVLDLWRLLLPGIASPEAVERLEVGVERVDPALRTPRQQAAEKVGARGMQP